MRFLQAVEATLAGKRGIPVERHGSHPIELRVAETRMATAAA